VPLETPDDPTLALGPATRLGDARTALPELALTLSPLVATVEDVVLLPVLGMFDGAWMVPVVGAVCVTGVVPPAESTGKVFPTVVLPTS